MTFDPYTDYLDQLPGRRRMLCWFSCGAASAVATKHAITRFGEIYDVIPVCCDTRPSENSDNYRFSRICEKWFGRPIVFISSDQYATIDEVFEKVGYMSGVKGARCTVDNIAHFERVRKSIDVRNAGMICKTE